MAQQAVHSGRALASHALKVVWIQRSGIWHGAVVLGMFSKRAESSSERIRQPRAEGGGHINSLGRLCEEPSLPQPDRFVQRNAEHAVGNFELFHTSAEDFVLFFG